MKVSAHSSVYTLHWIHRNEKAAVIYHHSVNIWLWLSQHALSVMSCLPGLNLPPSTHQPTSSTGQTSLWGAEHMNRHTIPKVNVCFGLKHFLGIKKRKKRMSSVLSFEPEWRLKAGAAVPQWLIKVWFQIRQGSLTWSCVLMSHTLLQYVKWDWDQSSFCLTPDCFDTDKCVTRRSKVKLLALNRKIRCHIWNSTNKPLQLPKALQWQQLLLWDVHITFPLYQWSSTTSCWNIQCYKQSAGSLTADL